MRNKVMLVDDHPAMLMAMKAMLLNQILFEVLGQAQNGEECLNEIKKSNPDILILDLDMPKTDGFDLIRRISISHPKIRILVLSSMDEHIYGGRVRSIGGHGYVNKTASANTSSQSLMVIMNNVLDISKIEAGKYTLEPQPTDLKKITS